MSDFLKNSSDDESDHELSELKKAIEPTKTETLEPETQKREKMEEYVEFVDTSQHDVNELNRYLLEKQNSGWKQRFPAVSHEKFLIFSWFKIIYIYNTIQQEVITEK